MRPRKCWSEWYEIPLVSSLQSMRLRGAGTGAFAWANSVLLRCYDASLCAVLLCSFGGWPRPHTIAQPPADARPARPDQAPPPSPLSTPIQDRAASLSADTEVRTYFEPCLGMHWCMERVRWRLWQEHHPLSASPTPRRHVGCWWSLLTRGVDSKGAARVC